MIMYSNFLPSCRTLTNALQTLSSQARLFKSLKLWSFYVDLEESIGTVETTKAVYDKILELRIANAQIIINYAAFLEENKYFEESFKVRVPEFCSSMVYLIKNRCTNAVSNCLHSQCPLKFGTYICLNL